MTSGEQEDLEARFAARLDEVLHAVANPEPAAGMESRIRRLMEEAKEAEMQAAPVYGESSVLWGSASVRAGWTRGGLWSAVLLHAAMLALVLTLAARQRSVVSVPVPAETVSLVTPPAPALPRPAAPQAKTAGGGGGQRRPSPVGRGTPPKFSPETLSPPKLPPLEEAKVEVPVTVELQPQLRMAQNSAIPLGVAAAPAVSLSMGNGRGTGLGSGAGSGVGAGSGGNVGGGLRRIGGGVSAPVVLFKPEPEFSDEARQRKVAGDVLVYLQVDEQGRPQHVRVLRGLGMGLDEKAVAAVERYRFQPAMENGHPVRVELQVDVDFHIY